MTGCNNKRRFSIKFPDGHIERFGSCDPKDDDGRIILKLNTLGEGYFLAQGQSVFPEFNPISLPPETFWTNGYYDTEHDGWKPMEEWK